MTIYLDHHATTPLDKRVLDEMMPYLTDKFGSASSVDHALGHDASTAVETARGKIAKMIGARQEDIIFTSGATESDNIALAGTMEKYGGRGDHLITCITEHKAVLDTAKYLEKMGKKVTYLSVNEYGEIDLNELGNAITDRTVMISIMTANNEIGTIADVAKIGKMAREKNVIFHTDAAQAVGHIPMNVRDMNIDLMSFSAHKMYGPKGIGALYVRGIGSEIKPEPIMHGEGQERNIRSGTLNVPAIVGFGKAADLTLTGMESENESYHRWSQKILESFYALGAKLNGHPEKRLSHNINIRFHGIDGKTIINSVSKDLAISAGSACTTQTMEPSHVLLALGLTEGQAHESIRIGCGRFNTDEEIDKCIKLVSESVQRFQIMKST